MGGSDSFLRASKCSATFGMDSDLRCLGSATLALGDSLREGAMFFSFERRDEAIVMGLVQAKGLSKQGLSYSNPV